MRLLLVIAFVVLLIPDVQAQSRRRQRYQEQPAVQVLPPADIGIPISSLSPSQQGEKASSGSTNAIDEVNAYRAARGLRPFINDPLLNQAAQAAASYRAARLINGHVSGGRGDFQFLPPGADCHTAGCGALEPSWGWGTCCMDGNYTYAGAAWVMGSDGKRYMHLFVR